MEMNEIKEYFESNKDSDQVKDFQKSLMPSLDQVMENEDFKMKMKSFADAEASRQVEAFRSKTLPETVEQEVKKRMEAATHKEPWEIKMAEMERNQTELMSKLKNKERDELISNNKTNALRALADKKLPSDLLDFLVSDESEKTTKNVETFSKMMENYTTNLKQEYMSSNNIKIPGKQEVLTDTGNIPKDDASKAEWEAYYRKKYSK